MTLTSRVAVTLTAALASALDLVTAGADLVVKEVQDFANGTGANQADKVYSDTRTIAASTTEDLDLAGGSLSDALGAALTFVKVRAILIIANEGNTNNLHVGGDANAVPIFGAAADFIVVKPGGLFLWTAPDAAGVTVTPGTGDILQVANSGAGSTVTYRVVILGTSA